MKTRVIVAAVATAVLGFPTGVHAATQYGPYTLGANGSIVSVTLPGGLWVATVTGTYKYDNKPFVPGWDSQEADAECSTASPVGDGTLDTVTEPDGLVPISPTVVGEWQRYRYLFITEPVGYMGYHPRDPLDVFVNNQMTEWFPPNPTLLGPPGLILGCDTATHRYQTVLRSDGRTPTTFQIFDLNYSDNSGALTVEVTQLG
jgi:hypothetical protein